MNMKVKAIAITFGLIMTGIVSAIVGHWLIIEYGPINSLVIFYAFVACALSVAVRLVYDVVLLKLITNEYDDGLEKMNEVYK